MYFYNCCPTTIDHSNETFNEFITEFEKQICTNKEILYYNYFTNAEVKPVGRGGEKVTSPNRCMKF